MGFNQIVLEIKNDTVASRLVEVNYIPIPKKGDLVVLKILYNTLYFHLLWK